MYVHDKKLTTGKLAVSVLECSRLQAADGAYSVYCTLSVGEQFNNSCHWTSQTTRLFDPGSLPWQPMVHLWRNQWPVYEFLVKKRAAEEIIGIKYKMVRMPISVCVCAVCVCLCVCMYVCMYVCIYVQRGII